MIKLLIGSLVLVAIAAAAYQPATRYWAERNKPTFRTAQVAQREVTLSVHSTGEVQPVLKVVVGSFVSGPIEALHVDFNDRVKKDQLLAEIDPLIYDAAVARDRAALVTREAEVKRVQAQLQQAVNDEKRSVSLRKESEDYISQAELDQYHFAALSLEAQLEVAEAAVSQAEANLTNSEANLEYTKIRSPVDGIIIEKKIDPGNTLAAQFQTPELFVIAPDMESKMLIYAAVDEADIGFIRRAQDTGQPVEFTVDAYPDYVFQGQIEQIRFSSTVNQNVVTYPVVVSAANPDLKLLPGMTATLAFTIEVKPDILCVPNAALRYYPADKKLVREDDRGLLEGNYSDAATDDDSDTPETPSAKKKREKQRRHVWMETVDGLKAIEVVTGISDNYYTEIVSGDVTVGQELVTDIKKDK